MKAPTLETSNSRIQLIEPDIARDAPLSLDWLSGKVGRTTLSLMGVSNEDNNPTSIEKERERIKNFIQRDDQLNWMIQFEDRIIGSVWIDLESTDALPAPAVHMMIGNPDARGKGVGNAAIEAVINYLTENDYESVSSRSLVNNNMASSLLSQHGFVDSGKSYIDQDGLEWQNAVRKLKR